MNDDPTDVHAARKRHMTPLVQMEEAERQFNQGQAAENRERQVRENERRDYQCIQWENEAGDNEEPSEDVTVPSIPPRPEVTQESRPRHPEVQDRHSDEERPERSILYSRPSIQFSVTSEGIREVTSEERITTPITTIPTDVAQGLPLPTWTSLSDHERILRRTRKHLQDTIQTICAEHGRLVQEMRQRTLDTLETTSTTSTEEGFVEGRR